MAVLNKQAVEFTKNKNRQKASYYTPPFWQPKKIPHGAIENEHFKDDKNCLLEHEIEILDAYMERTDLVIWIKSCALYRVLEILKNKRQYETLSEMSAIDYLDKKGGFELFYQLLCYERKMRLRVRTFIEKHEKVQTVSTIFKSADWSEREMYDMFGIIVENHPNFKRILMPDDWYDHPLLKTYPLHGDEAAQWYEVDKIFGKEYRDVVGPENRDSSKIERYDTKRFARIGHEVPYGADITQGEQTQQIHYQEEGGVFLVKQLKPEMSKQLKERK